MGEATLQDKQAQRVSERTQRVSMDDTRMNPRQELEGNVRKPRIGRSETTIDASSGRRSSSPVACLLITITSLLSLPAFCGCYTNMVEYETVAGHVTVRFSSTHPVLQTAVYVTWHCSVRRRLPLVPVDFPRAGRSVDVSRALETGPGVPNVFDHPSSRERLASLTL